MNSGVGRMAKLVPSGTSSMRPRRAFWLCGGVSLLALGWGVFWFVSESRFQSGLERARADIKSKRFETAGRWLAVQRARRP